jgi:regulator of sigma E protease
METFLIKALQLILSLSILVIIHEFGHYIFARIFKIRVEKFYLFFDAGFALFRHKPKNSETEYGIGWLPLGGYVKIAGMLDESMDKEQLAQPPQPWEFRTKPAWQRLLVMIGGVLFNVLLAIFIYAMVLFAWGDSYVSFKDMKYGMKYGDVAKEAGFHDNDIIINADGKELKLRFSRVLDSNELMHLVKAKKVLVERNGSLQTIELGDDFADKVIASGQPLCEMVNPAVVDSVLPNSEAQKIGLMKGDSIVSVQDTAVASFVDMAEIVSRNKDKDITLAYYRGDSLYNVSAHVSQLGQLGFSSHMKLTYSQLNFFTSFPAGIVLAKETIQGYLSQLPLVFSKAGISNVGGFGAIGSLFPAQWDWRSFWMMTAFLSVILAVMNILPIPILDGGHVMFLLYEIITRRKPNEKFMEYAMTAGMVFIIALLVYANGNDVYKAVMALFNK